ncbi:MAG: leucine-rich repeat domain-containing protein, partial [Candidatus Ventricola sp.]
MRKTWCLVWAALLALMLSSSCALAEIARGTCGDSLTWVLADNGTLTISGSGAMTDWDSADTEWSNYNERLVKVVIEEGVTSIGRNAFCYMSMLTEAQIASTVVSIEASAFTYCSSLASVTGASGVKTIGDDAFAHCSTLAAYPFAQGLQSIGSCAFDTSGLLSANLPDSVTSIGDAALYGTPLTSVTLPQGLTSIPSSLLQMCGSLQQVTVPAGVTSIGKNAFYSCTSAQITLPDNVATIGEGAFNAAGRIVCGLGSVTAKALSACGEGYRYSTPENPDLLFYDEEGEIILQSYAGVGGDVTIPSGVTVIQLSAFENCSTVTGVTIPDTVKTIRAWAFKGCTGLEHVTVPASVTTMSESVFEGCSALQSATLLASLKEIPESLFLNCTSLESVTLPAGVTALGAGMFSGCSKLKDVTLPAGLTEIHANAFTGCAALTSLPLPAGVTEIGAEAFKDCTGLTAVDIPAGVTIIWACAYQGCTSAVITLPDNVSLYGDALTGVKQIICNPNTKTARGLSQAPFTMKGNPAFTLKQTDVNSVAVVSYTGSRENVVVPEGITEWIDTETTYVNLRLQRTPPTNGDFRLRAKNVTIPDGVTSLPSTTLYGTEKLYLPDSLQVPAETLSLNTAPTIYCSEGSDAYAWYRNMGYRIVTTDSGTPVLSLKDATELVMDVDERRTIAADSFTLMPFPADYRGEVTLEVVSGTDFIKAEGDTFTGVKSGSAQLRATVDGQYACTVPVRVCPEVTSFFLSGQIMAERGGEFQMGVFGLAPSGVSGRLTWYVDDKLVYTGTDDVVTLTAPTAKDQETTTVRVVAPGGLTKKATIELHDSVSEPYLLSSTVELFGTVQICVDVDGKQRINDLKTFDIVSFDRDRLELDLETETLKTKKKNETFNLDQNEGEAMFILMSVTGKRQEFTITVQCTQHADTARYDEQPPTCLYAGFKAYYQCKNCGKFRLDQEGSQWIPPV